MVDTDELQRQMERYLAHFNRAGKRATILFTASAQPTPAWSPALDMYETQDSIVVLLDLAGVDADKTEVHTQPHLLTVRGVRRERHGRYAPNEQRNYHALEIPYGRFERSVRLPPGIDTDAARASYRDGLLEITLPKRLPSQITVTSEGRVHAEGGRS
ncbi:MAG: Hsp20/alpha crystallin family protein [Chloroflexota bacterium]|nr:Hsp20/alpha crystallin family protein [Chloroflexota bacterium]